MTSTAIGLSLFWAALLCMLVRNGAPALEAGAAFPQQSLILRVAFFVGFAATALVASHLPKGTLGARGTAVSSCLVVLFSLDTAATGACVALGIARPFVASALAWAIMGAGMAGLLLLWLPLIARLNGRALASCLALSAGTGAVLCLALNALEGEALFAFLALAPLASLALRMRLAADVQAMRQATTGGAGAQAAASPESARKAGAEGNGAARRGARLARWLPCDVEPAIPLAQSRRNACLSWAFGIVNVIYGVVFGLAAGTITQWGDRPWLPAGFAAVGVLGACCAFAFMTRSRGRVQQSTVMRLLFPVLVIALVPQALFSGVVPLVCCLLVMGCYVFLSLVSIGFEIRGAHARNAAPLYFVGMSQTTFAAGIAGGFALGMLPGVSGAFNHATLSGIALVLVVVLAVIVATAQDPMASAQSAADATGRAVQEQAERAATGRWKARCNAVAQAAGLSARETEVFMLLAKGRGTEHIQNKLGISSHTVKTHTYNIYHKMGIGSREELLDAVEAASPDGSASAQP